MLRFFDIFKLKLLRTPVLHCTSIQFARLALSINTERHDPRCNHITRSEFVSSSLMMFAKLVVWWLCIQQPASFKESKRAFQAGDIMLGGLTVLHYKDSQDKCGLDFFPVGLGHAEATIFAIERYLRVSIDLCSIGLTVNRH